LQPSRILYNFGAERRGSIPTIHSKGKEMPATARENLLEENSQLRETIEDEALLDLAAENLKLVSVVHSKVAERLVAEHAAAEETAASEAESQVAADEAPTPAPAPAPTATSEPVADANAAAATATSEPAAVEPATEASTSATPEQAQV
jgi:hypothetical protein